MHKIGNLARWMSGIATMGLAAAILSGCATPRAGDEVNAAEVYSPGCSVGLIMEWDGTAGASTRTEELEATLAYYEERAAALPAVEEVPADDSRTASVQDDPIRVQVAVRGLKALIASLPVAERDAAPDDTVTVEATTESGTELALAIIVPHSAGGYRIDQLTANGWESDHPSCAVKPQED